MLRATLTILTAAGLTLSGGLLVLTAGLALPWRWCFDPCFRVWSRGILAAAGVRLRISGADHLDLDRNYFYVGNHQGVMDIPAMAVATRGHVRFMAKKSLFGIPVFGWILRCFGFVPIDRSNARSAKSAIDSMLSRLADKGGSMLVFPEGTRSDDGRVLPFRRGSIQVCRRAGLPLVPFAIEGSLAIHRRGAFRLRPGPLRITLGQPIGVDEVTAMSADDLQTRLRDEVIRLQQGVTGSTESAAASTVAGVGGAS